MMMKHAATACCGVQANGCNVRVAHRSRPARGQEVRPYQAPALRGDTSYGPDNMDENLVQREQKIIRRTRDRVPAAATARFNP